MGHSGRTKSTVHLISSQKSQEEIKCTNVKEQLKYYCLIYIMCPRPKQRPTQQHQLLVNKWRSVGTVVNFPKFEALWQFSRCGLLCYRFLGIWFWSWQLIFYFELVIVVSQWYPFFCCIWISMVYAEFQLIKNECF